MWREMMVPAIFSYLLFVIFPSVSVAFVEYPDYVPAGMENSVIGDHISGDGTVIINNQEDHLWISNFSSYSDNSDYRYYQNGRASIEADVDNQGLHAYAEASHYDYGGGYDESNMQAYLWSRASFGLSLYIKDAAHDSSSLALNYNINGSVVGDARAYVSMAYYRLDDENKWWWRGYSYSEYDPFSDDQYYDESGALSLMSVPTNEWILLRIDLQAEAGGMDWEYGYAPIYGYNLADFRYSLKNLSLDTDFGTLYSLSLEDDTGEPPIGGVQPGSPVPVPGTILLLGSGLAALAGMKFNKK